MVLSANKVIVIIKIFVIMITNFIARNEDHITGMTLINLLDKYLIGMAKLADVWLFKGPMKHMFVKVFDVNT